MVRKYKTMRVFGQLHDFSRPMVMGILNITPDSFYDGGQFLQTQKVVDHCAKMLIHGADIIDVGAFSSRPGAQLISEKEELDRLIPVLSLMREHFPKVIISVDTYRSNVAKVVVESYGVNIINDISGGVMDEQMIPTIAELQVPYVMMHMKGTVKDMQHNPQYSDLMGEISMFFSQQLQKCAHAGVLDVIIDPGFGFGKTLNHNYELLNKLPELSLFECPLLVGVSRKSMIYKVLDGDPDGALNGTTAINTVALLKGANILRVHDVKEAVECIKLVQHLTEAGN